MFSTPALDGNPIFGAAVNMQVAPQPASYHLVEFFGINGLASVFGGKRGRLITVEGSLNAPDLATLNLYEGTFETYVDGFAHVLADTRGREWTNVVFNGDFQADPEGPRPLCGSYNEDGSNYLTLRYKAAFLALV